jgi:PucR C-terminal helix-turn-helix domain
VGPSASDTPARISRLTLRATGFAMFGTSDRFGSRCLSETTGEHAVCVRVPDVAHLHSGDRQRGTLRHIVETVGSPLLHVLAAPRGLQLRVRSTVLHDLVDELSLEPDAILLLAGMRADDPAAATLMRRVADCGFCAVVIKRRGADVSGLVTEASIHGVTVLAAADEVPWRHLDSLLLSVLGSQGVAAESATGVGDELFALANAIAAVIGGSVAVEDLDRRVLAYSSVADQRIDDIRERGILSRHVPEMAENLEQYRSVLAGPGVVRFAQRADELARSAIAIKAGSRPLGTIWAIESVAGLTSEGERSLTEGARLAAITILRSHNASGLDAQLREAALLGAIDGSVAGHESAFRLALASGVELSLIGYAPVPSAAGVVPLISHVASSLARYVAAYRPDASMATTSRAIYVMLPGGGPAAVDRFSTGSLTATQETFPGQVRVAISQPSSDPAQLPVMRHEIDDILRVTMQQSDLPEVSRLGHVHTRVILSRIADELQREPRLRHPGITAMSAYDVEHGTDFISSVAAWLDAIGDIASAAASLGIHPNTLRYRLRRISDLFDLSLSLPDDRLSIWLQVRLAKAQQ